MRLRYYQSFSKACVQVLENFIVSHAVSTHSTHPAGLAWDGMKLWWHKQACEIASKARYVLTNYIAPGDGQCAACLSADCSGLYYFAWE